MASTSRAGAAATRGSPRAPGGLLVYETFTRRQPELGWGPKNPAFLLDDAELPTLFRGLEVLEHVESLRSGGNANAWLAGLVARAPK